MGKRGNYVLVTCGKEMMMCESDDPRLEDKRYTVESAKFIKGKSEFNGKKVAGRLKVNRGKGVETMYLVYTSGKVEETAIN